tara:strand:+ start:30 stop:587 length:558 start_codon:yes stop_codon:yes gene_type:complete
MKMTVTKTVAELYQVRSDTGSLAWGDITLKCGSSSVSVTATSDYGTFDHYWSHCGGEPKAFLTSLDFDYTMKKLSGGKLWVADVDAYENEIKTRIIEYRKDDCISKEEARTAWGEMLAINEEFDGGDMFFNALYEHDLFCSIFGDCESMPSATKYSGRCVDFYNDIWTPFIETLKVELLGKEKHD